MLELPRLVLGNYEKMKSQDKSDKHFPDSSICHVCPGWAILMKMTVHNTHPKVSYISAVPHLILTFVQATFNLFLPLKNVDLTIFVSKNAFNVTFFLTKSYWIKKFMTIYFWILDKFFWTKIILDPNFWTISFSGLRVF